MCSKRVGCDDMVGAHLGSCILRTLAGHQHRTITPRCWPPPPQVLLPGADLDRLHQRQGRILCDRRPGAGGDRVRVRCQHRLRQRAHQGATTTSPTVLPVRCPPVRSPLSSLRTIDSRLRGWSRAALSRPLSHSDRQACPSPMLILPSAAPSSHVATAAFQDDGGVSRRQRRVKMTEEGQDD